MKIDPKNWFLQHFPRARSNSKGDRLRHACPFHDDSPSGGGSFVMFLPKGNFVCKSDGCAKKGPFAALYKEVEQIPWAEVYQRLQITNLLQEANDDIGVALFGAPATKPITPSTSGVVKRINPLPSYGLIPVAEQWPKYLTQRGYAPGSIDPYGLMWGSANEYKGFLVFPFWDPDGNYLSYTARKMSFIKAEGRYVGPEGNTNDQLLYGVHVLRNMGVLKRICVVEGQFDVMRLWTYGEVAVGLSNKDATHAQMRLIGRLAERHGSKVCVLLDGSASKWTEKLTNNLRANCQIDARSVFIPLDKDPDTTPREVIKGLLDESTDQGLERHSESDDEAVWFQ